jgi:hypothetical protein
MADTL